jgi:hypothetical protein
MVFQAGTPVGSVMAAVLSGRWVAASALASLAGNPFARQEPKTLGFR